MVIKILNLLVLALIAATTTAAETSAVEIGPWNYFPFVQQGFVTPQFTVTLPQPGHFIVTDFQCIGDTYIPVVNSTQYTFSSAVEHFEATEINCMDYGTSPDEALRLGRFSWSAFALPPGQHLIKFVVQASPFYSGIGAFKVSPGPFVRPSDKPAFVPLLLAKVADVDAAARACRGQGFRLADVYAGTMKSAAIAVRESGALALPGAKTVEQFFIASWDGNTYGGVNLALYVSQKGASMNQADGNPHYALCETVPGALPNYKVEATELKIGNLDGLSVVGPAGPFLEYGTKCALVGKVPAVLYGSEDAVFKEASRIVFEALGQKAQVWLRGWDTEQSNVLMMFSVDGGSASGSATPIDSSLPRAYLCRNKAAETDGIKARRSEL
ncbi:hypothetical protein H9P43_002484 [Blastocladiella emersonii ATCC 22665]|nr:hypothetical protein H9P43_002484 [Blastocladiella emersonii ATCC 22665]